MGERVRTFKSYWANHVHKHWLLAVLGGLGLAAGLMLVFSRIEQLEWFREERVGTAGEWFSGIAAAAALLFLAAGQAQARRDSAETKEVAAAAKREADEERHAAEKRRQAEQVTAWPIEWAEFAINDEPFYKVVVRVRNPTQSAIYHVSAGVGLKRDSGYWHTNEHQILGPGEEIDLALDGIGLLSDEKPLLPPILLLAFTDAAGQHWWRTPDELKPMHDHMRPDHMRPDQRRRP